LPRSTASQSTVNTYRITQWPAIASTAPSKHAPHHQSIDLLRPTTIDAASQPASQRGQSKAKKKCKNSEQWHERGGAGYLIYNTAYDTIDREQNEIFLIPMTQPGGDDNIAIYRRGLMHAARIFMRLYPNNAG